jgi:signal transduction histidine kinase
MSPKQAIESNFMDRVLQIKLLLIFLFVGVTGYFFYDELFIQSTKTLHAFGEMAVLVASISFGVIIAASIYNLSFYFYIKSRQYLYYGLAQLSTLFFLINLDSLFIAPFDRIFGLKSITLFCVAGVLLLSFSLLFIYEFLKDYHIEKINRLIKGILLLAVVDFLLAIFFSFSLFTTFLFVPIWLVLSEANRLIKEKDLPFYFLLTGWYIAIFVATIEHLGFIKFIGTPFPFLHITFAVESIFLSLAIAYKFKLVEEKQKTQQAILLQQSRLASMGEMISTIAHQWRQPLNILSVLHMNLNRMHKEPDSRLVLTEANKQINYMSNTIDTFRDFYNPSKAKEKFSLKRASQNALKIISHTLQSSHIEVIERFEEDRLITGNRNEFEQVILNLLNNAKDAIDEQKITHPLIEISLKNGNLSIKDNAGGISKKNIEKIFNPYFSTKKESDGIGLYISKMIIEQEMGGRLEVKSNQKETIFYINFNNYT